MGATSPSNLARIKSSLALFPPKARQLILDERVPLGRILKECEIPHATFAKAFFRVAPDELISSVLNLNSPTWLYGRKATILDGQKTAAVRNCRDPSGLFES